MPESAMRTKTFRPYDQDTLLLMPPSVRDWVTADSLASFIDVLVNELDLAPFLAAHDEPRGMPPYHPAMMLKVLLYGYATGVTSSRKLEERLRSDVGFMFLAGQARPGHKAIGEFRRRHLAAFATLFLGSLVLCREAGMVKLGRVALDGTKVKANASKHKAMSYGRMAERETALAAQVAAILAEAEAVDVAEDARYGDARGDELPPELRTLDGKLRKIRAAKAALEADARERTGDPDALPDPKAQRNFTDPESRIMLSKPDGWIYGYNAQAVVDEAHQVIVATDLTTDATDTRQLPALLDGVRANTGRHPRRLLADAGYQSDENLAALDARGIDAYVAVRRERPSAPPGPAPRGRIPKDLSRRERMARKLRTKAGRAHYARRKVIVEPVFGQIKESGGFRRFRLRGKRKVSAEWQLVCAVHNLGKLFRSGRAGRVMAGWGRSVAPAGGRMALGWA